MTEDDEPFSLSKSKEIKVEREKYRLSIPNADDGASFSRSTAGSASWGKK